VRAYEATRLAVVARATVNGELAALRLAFNSPVETGRLATKPLIRTPDPKSARTGFVESVVLAAILDELPAWATPVVEFLALTGWRVRSEVLPLTWKNVDGRAKVVRLEPGTTKNRQGREFPFGEYPTLKALLDRQHAEQSHIEREKGAESDYVFPVPGADHRDTRYKRLRKAFRAACREGASPGDHPPRAAPVRGAEPRTRGCVAVGSDEPHRPPDRGRLPPLRHRQRGDAARGGREAREGAHADVMDSTASLKRLVRTSRAGRFYFTFISHCVS
jgi:integrase